MLDKSPFCSRCRFAVIAVTGVSCFALAAPALAQTAPQADSPPAEATQPEAGLQDIVVTARKRAENLRDVPVAITAIGGDMLQQKNTPR